MRICARLRGAARACKLLRECRRCGRHKVNQLMEGMKNIHAIEKLAPGGTLDAAALANKLSSL